MAAGHERLLEKCVGGARPQSPDDQTLPSDDARGSDAEPRPQSTRPAGQTSALVDRPGPSAPSTEAPTQPPAEPSCAPLPPALRVGSYRILDVLGEGSMGVVYRAEQDNPHRVVALKVLKAGGATPAALQRFQHEAQMLGRLQHPGIAQIFEAGTADPGYGPQPFFAMELVHGMPLKDYADAHDLDIPERLALMIRVCAGVHHAHQKRVIHCDLKPGNILVDESGQPKIVDFGISLATVAKEGTAVSRSGSKHLAGTAPYMSPEQLQGNADDLDTRADVYALGVIAYQLLSGRLPYDLARATIPEAARIVGEREPELLSGVDRSLRGDLELIITTALARDRKHRYQSASDLAADIGRFLSNEPIQAHPPSVLYQFSRFAKRNRAVVGTVAAMFVVLLAAVIVSTSLYLDAERARARAFAEAGNAQATSGFLLDMLTAADPRRAQGESLTVRHVLDAAADEIEAGKLTDQPEVELAAHLALGKTYRSLGLYDAAESHLSAAMEISRRKLGVGNPKTLASMNELGRVYKDQGRYEEAETLHRLTLETCDRVLGREHPETLRSMQRLAKLYESMGRYARAELLYTRAWQSRKRLLGAEHADTLESLNDLAALYRKQERRAEAESLHRTVLDARRRTLGNEHPDTLLSINNLALVLKEDKDKRAEAENLYREALATQRRVLGDEHPETILSLNNLAVLLKAEGKLAEAAALYRQTLEIRRRVLGDDHPSTLTSMQNLAAALQAQGELPAAEELYRETLELLRGKLGDDHPWTITTIEGLGYLLTETGEYDAAESLYREALRLRRESLPEQHVGLTSVMIHLAGLLAEHGNPAEGEKLLRECVTIRRQAFGTDDWRTANAESALGACLTVQKRFGEAEPLLLRSYPIIRDEWGAGDRRTQRASGRIVDLYDAWGKPGKAAEWRNRH